MFKRTLSLLLCIVLIFTMVVSLCACKDEENSEYPVTIGDFTIEKEPLSIVVLSDCLCDIISYMGYDLKMVGRNLEADQDFISIVPIVGTAQECNIDSIISYEADLVIAEDSISEESKNALAQNNIPLLVLNRANSYEELKSLYVNLGTVLGGNTTGKAQGESSYDELMKTISDFEDAVPGNIVKTACYLYIDEHGTLCTLTKGTVEYELFSHCAAINVFSAQEEPQVDLEQLKISTPSYIFYDDPAVLDILNENDELSNMGALKDNHTMQIKKRDFYRQGKTYEETIYQMIEFMFIKGVATNDEAPTETETQPEDVISDTQSNVEEETSVGFVS